MACEAGQRRPGSRRQCDRYPSARRDPVASPAHDDPGAAMSAAPRQLRIAQVAPPLERVPPAAYGGTERIAHELTTELVRRGHDVTVFASGDSDVPCRLVPTVDAALRPAGVEGDAGGWFASTVKQVLEQASEFDVIHSHLEWWSVPLGRMSPVPVAATFHGRLDLPWADRL